MLLRHDERGVLAIGQSSHAWISGQLARAWGNERFPPPEPRDELCLAAEQHDIGMAEWDLEPSFNPETGLPHSFIEMPLEVHMGLWRAAPRQVLTQSPYAALLISMHGSRLYRMRDLDRMTAADADRVRHYLSDQERLQADIARALGRHPGLLEGRLEFGSQLIWTWDYLSLALCLRWQAARAREVPVVDGAVDVRVTGGADGGAIRLEPWPLGEDRVTVRCVGRRLETRYESAQAMLDALARAPWETLALELRA